MYFCNLFIKSFLILGSRNQDLAAKNRCMISFIAYVFLHVQPIAPAFLYFKEPFNVRYWPIRFKKFVSTDSRLDFLYILIGFIIDTWASIFVLFPAGFIVLTLIAYFAKLKLWLNFTKMQNADNMGLRAVQSYMIIEMVNQIGFSTLSTSILPTCYSIAHIFITMMFAALAKNFSNMPLELQLNTLGASYVILLIIKVVIRSSGEISDESIDTKNTLKNRVKSVHLRKQISARRDIRIYFNSVFYMEKSTFTVFLDSAINNTITVILAG